MLGILKYYDVARVEMDPHALALEAIDEGIHSSGVIKKPLKKMFSIFRLTFCFSASGTSLRTASIARSSHTSLGTGS